jgi:hypothetical protein
MKLYEVVDTIDDTQRLIKNNYTINQLSGIENVIKLYDKGRIPLRGVPNKTGEDIFIRTVRTDRRPMSTSKVIHDVLNKAFFELFGFPYRTAAVFTTLSKDDAITYGDDVYCIFPTGPYTVCYSPKIYDLYEFEYQIINVVKVQDPDNNFVNLIGNEDIVEAIKRWVLEQKYREIDSLNKLEENLSVELMIKCKQYLALKPDVLQDVAYKLNQ